MLKRGLMQIVFAALLLIAQHGALTHHVRHLQDRLPAQTAGQQDKKQNPAHTALCDFHVSFAQVLGAVDCAAIPLQLANNAVERSGNHFPPAVPAASIVPASRGPPVLL
ncbi:MAG: hypothetical protein ABIS45_10105 [Burkholderiales bacterium]